MVVTRKYYFNYNNKIHSMYYVDSYEKLEIYKDNLTKLKEYLLNDFNLTKEQKILLDYTYILYESFYKNIPNMISIFEKIVEDASKIFEKIISIENELLSIDPTAKDDGNEDYYSENIKVRELREEIGNLYYNIVELEKNTKLNDIIIDKEYYQEALLSNKCRFINNRCYTYISLNDFQIIRYKIERIMKKLSH